MIKNKQHFISVIVPVYKQENTIRQDIYSIYNTLEKIRYNYEIIAVVDGTTLDKSFNKLKEIKLKKLKVVGYRDNRGKGYAIRYAMARSQGDYIAFIDAGMEIDPNGISLLIEHLEWYGADIIVGSKFHPASRIIYPFYRRIITFFAHIMARYLLDIPVHDTQAGIKIFRKPVLVRVLPRLLVKTFAFDLEILSVAKRLGFTKIYEAPIKLTYDFYSVHLNGSFIKIICQCFIDTLAIFYRLRIRKYYDDRNKRKWVYDKQLDMRINTGA